MSLQLTTTQLATIAHAFGFTHESLPPAISVSGGFSGAAVWKLPLEDSHYALRRWPANSIQRPRILGLHRLLHWWSSQGFPEFAVPLASRDGSSLIHFESHDWQLEPWMPGLSNFHDHPNDARLQAAMHWLARLHLVTPRYHPDSAFREWFQSQPLGISPAVSERLDLIQTWPASRLATFPARISQIPDAQFHLPLQGILEHFLRHASRIGSELQLARNLPVPLFPVLRDFWHDHLLFTDDQLTGVIDPAACRTESVASDLSRLLGSLFPFDKSRWDQALAYYSTIRPLTLNESQLLEILDRSQVLLAGLHWLERLTISPTIPDPHSLLPRLQTIHHRLKLL